MTDVHALLAAAGQVAVAPVPVEQIDADLARGRRARARRRRHRLGVRSLLLGAIATFAVAVVHPGGHAQAAVDLVPYAGQQPPGFTVDQVPSGWVLQGADRQALVIARADDPDRDLSHFEDKLVVLLASIDQTPPTSAPSVAVGAGTGIVIHPDPETSELFFTDPAGHSVVIQAPSALHWSDRQLGAFGASVHVNANAQAGRG